MHDISFMTSRPEISYIYLSLNFLPPLYLSIKGHVGHRHYFLERNNTAYKNSNEHQEKRCASSSLWESINVSLDIFWFSSVHNLLLERSK